MEDTEKNIWQRVAAGPKPVWNGEDGKRLLREAGETEAIYRSLAARIPGGERLLQEQRETVACLMGIGKLAGISMVRPWFPGPRNSPEKLLMLAYPRTLAAIREYTARMADPQFGSVYRLLAQREEGQCLRVLTLLGSGTAA